MSQELLLALGDPASYTAPQLRDFIIGYRKRGLVAANNAASSARMFLRYLSSQGRCASQLTAALPSFAHWRLSTLPRFLTPDEIERAIDACAQGQHPWRDRAILLLLSRLALRAGDVVTLRLSDIDWQRGSLRIVGKGRREVELPLLREVGEALADYLTRERPPSRSACVFVRSNAPFAPLGRLSTLSAIARLALNRAGIESAARGAHVFRHSTATALLREGQSLDQIALLLRHKSLTTTMQYAKVDVAALALVAQPWPEEVSSC